MKKYLAIVLLGLVLCHSSAWAQRGRGWRPSVSDRPIDSGYVVLEGRYFSPPYRIECNSGEVTINGNVLPSAKNWQGLRWRRRFSSESTVSPEQLAWILRHSLDNDGLILGIDQESIGLVRGGEGYAVMLAIVGGRSFESLTQNSDEHNRLDWLHEEQWVVLQRTVTPTKELIDRTGLLDFPLPFGREVFAHTEETQGASRTLLYGTTVGGMMLVVFAVSTLLRNRPSQKSNWREQDSSKDAVGLVVRCVALIIVMGLFDLACTVSFAQTGEFQEINPAVQQFVSSPLVLSLFKVCSLGVGALILLGLRSYHGAQIGSWWMCALCTVLTLRWVTFSSLFVNVL